MFLSPHDHAQFREAISGRSTTVRAVAANPRRPIPYGAIVTLLVALALYGALVAFVESAVDDLLIAFVIATLPLLALASAMSSSKSKS
jgi:hypothetical protein